MKIIIRWMAHLHKFSGTVASYKRRSFHFICISMKNCAGPLCVMVISIETE